MTDAKTTAELEMWRRLALHALDDLRIIGVDITKIVGITPEVVAQVDDYSRSMESFS